MLFKISSVLGGQLFQVVESMLGYVEIILTGLSLTDKRTMIAAFLPLQKF